MALGFLAGCAFLAFLVKKKIDLAKKILAARGIDSANTGHALEEHHHSGKSSASVLQRAALNHLQIIGLLGRFNFKWSAPVKTFFSSTESLAAASVTSGFDIFSAFSVDESIKCLLYSPSLPYPANEMLVNMYNLGATTVTVLLFWLIAGRGRPNLRNVMISLIVLLYMSYSKILRSLFQLFDCTKLDGFFAELRLQGALDVECSMEDVTYRTSMLTLAAPITVMYLVPSPFLALWKLNRSDRGEDKTITVYGFLYSGYKKEYWYWEVLVLLRKVLVAAISVFLSAEVSSANDLQVNSSQYQQGLLATLVISVALYIQLKLEPYEGADLNGVESMGLVVSVMSLYLGLWTFYGKESYVIDTTVTVLVFGINGCWFLYTLVSLFKEYKVVKYLKSIVGFLTCQRKKREDKRGSGGERGKEDGVGEAKNKKAAGASNKKMKDTKVMSDIEMPQIQVSNPLLSLPEGGGGLEGKVKSKKYKSNMDSKDAHVNAAKVMINPLTK